MPDVSDQRLACVVAKDRAQRLIDELKQAGSYDNRRHVREWDDTAVAIPVTEPPETVSYREIVRQVGEPRTRTLADYLRERGWTDAEIDRAPASWAVIGSVVMVELEDVPRRGELGEALLALHGEADTVVATGPISGPHREPAVEVIAGSGDTETVHHEHGTAYALDVAEVMFSPGNKAERARMGDAVEPDERVFDMFAGIGYFTLPMARAGAAVTAVEHNPTSFRYLVENARLNEVGDLIDPYRADCRDVTLEHPADRVVMGYYDATDPDNGQDTYLDSAFAALRDGGQLHVHDATPESLGPARTIDRLHEAAGSHDLSVEILDTHVVKSYSAGVNHIVVDATVSGDSMA
jgi:tRNA wybutosine-synthesizing protein 2